jgi:hypothetical protein
MVASRLEIRAGRHAALGDPVCLAIVDSLASLDRSPVELRRLTGIESNLLAQALAEIEMCSQVTARVNDVYVRAQRRPLERG